MERERKDITFKLFRKDLLELGLELVVRENGNCGFLTVQDGNIKVSSNGGSSFGLPAVQRDIILSMVPTIEDYLSNNGGGKLPDYYKVNDSSYPHNPL